MLLPAGRPRTSDPPTLEGRLREVFCPQVVMKFNMGGRKMLVTWPTG